MLQLTEDSGPPTGVYKNDGELILSEVKATPMNLLAAGLLLLFATRPFLFLGVFWGGPQSFWGMIGV